MTKSHKNAINHPPSSDIRRNPPPSNLCASGVGGLLNEMTLLTVCVLYSQRNEALDKINYYLGKESKSKELAEAGCRKRITRNFTG